MTPAQSLALAVGAARSRGTLATSSDRAWLAALRPSTWEHVWTPALLRLAHDALASDLAPGLDRAHLVSVTRPYLEVLWARTVEGRYAPGPLRRFSIEQKGKRREIGVPTVADQVLLAAWRLAFGPAIDRLLADHVWGFRRGRDRFGAVRRLTLVEGARVLVRTDIRRMFESLDHRILFGFVQGVFGEGLPLELVRQWVEGWSPGIGVPTGASVSPALSNLYLARTMDGAIAGMLAEGSVRAAVRYADDFALLGEDGAAVIRTLAESANAARLTLHTDKTRVHELAVPGDWPALVLGVPLRPVGAGHRLADQ